MNTNTQPAPILLSRKYPRSSVLIIEDTPDHWLLMEAAFRQYLPQEKLVWVTGSNGAMAHLDECVDNWQNLPQLILLDLYLPDREHGIQLLQELKMHPHYGRIPLVVLSYSDNLVDIMEAYQKGANSYCFKPVDPRQWPALFETLKVYWWDTITLPKQ